MRLTKATPQAVKYACENFHYSKAVPVNSIAYNVYNDKDEWCGVILFGTGATPNIGKPYDIPMGGIVELTRVALNGKQEHTSQAVAMALSQLKKDCPYIRLVISYADIDQRHLGTIYQATNWIYVGTCNEETITGFIVNGKKTHKKTIYSRIVVINGVRKHCPQTIEAVRKYIDKDAQEYISKGKRKYLFPMDKKMRKQIEKLRQPYPKEEGWTKIDRQSFHDVENQI